MRRLFTTTAMLACGAAFGANGAVAARYQRQPGIAVDHYVYALDVGDTTHAIKGETVATVRIVTTGADHIVFDLAGQDKSGNGMTVSAVSDKDSGAALRYTHLADRLTIQLGRAMKAGDVIRIAIAYAGTPADGMRFGTSRGNQRVMFTWNWPTKMHDWAPSLDHVSSKVTTEFVVTAPEQYSVVANGMLDSEVSLGDGRKVTHWKQGVPITPWLNAIGIARFQVYYGGTERGVPLQIWAPAGEKVDVDTGFQTARRTIDFYGDTMGPFPYEKLAQVAAPFDRSSTEHASVIFYGDGGTRDGEKEMTRRDQSLPFSHPQLMAHEIAHQWFGDSITEDSWGDVWLSEAFATYFADLYSEHYDGRDAFVASLKSERTGALAAERRERDPVVMAPDEAAGPKLTRVQYAKGGWVLHMLRQQITTPVFLKAIKVYYARYQGGHATTADLRRTMEEVSGQKLGWFFDQWLLRVDSPKLDVSWSYDAGAKAVKLVVTQTQAGDAYRLPIEVGIADAPRGPLRVAAVEMAGGKRQEFSIPAATAPAELVFDPDTKLLADTTLTMR